MSLYDPDAAGKSAQYLRLDPVQLMEIRSAPFDGKTAVWVPYNVRIIILNLGGNLKFQFGRY